jgi:hypothetical protein
MPLSALGPYPIEAEKARRLRQAFGLAFGDAHDLQCSAYRASSLSNALAFFRSAVSNPSVNQLYTAASNWRVTSSFP